jgi:hypothetical protein
MGETPILVIENLKHRGWGKKKTCSPHDAGSISFKVSTIPIIFLVRCEVGHPVSDDFITVE